MKRTEVKIYRYELPFGFFAEIELRNDPILEIMKQLDGQITFDDLMKEEETNIKAKIMNDKIKKLDNIYEVYLYSKYLVSKEKGEWNMKIRITGLPHQVNAMVSTIEEYCGVQINSISKEYPQNRKCKTSKYVAVYLDVQDFKE